jgi:RNA polymerase sigma factor (sigma-70 family)
VKNQPLPGRLALDHLHLVQPIAARLKRRLPESADLDDLTASGSLGLVRFAHRFDPARGVPFEVPARKWIRGHILHSVQGARFRDLKHASIDDDLHPLPEPRRSAFSAPSIDDDPERAALARDLWDRVLSAVDRLSPLRRAIIQLRHFEGLEMPEVAQRLGLSSKNAWNLRMRAIADLRRMLRVNSGPAPRHLKRAA